jgi:signal transduction histidine kinase
MKPEPADDGIKLFRRRLQLAIMMVVAALTTTALMIVQHKLSTDAETAMQREFQRTFDAMSNVHSLRYAMLLERCRELGRKVVLHLETNHPPESQPYQVMQEVLADIVEAPEGIESHHEGDGFHAEFCRLLDPAGAVIEPGPAMWAGPLLPDESAQLKLPAGLIAGPQLGYLHREQVDGDGPIFDLIAIPLLAGNEPSQSATLILGFEPASRLLRRSEPGYIKGLWFRGEIYHTTLPAPAARQVADALGAALARTGNNSQPIPLTLGGVPHLLLFQQLNAESAYAAAYQICLLPMTELQTRLAKLRWQVLGAGGLLLLTGLLASRTLAARFAQPVEILLRSLSEQRDQRRQAETAYQQAAAGMQRAARFSADASHQLKTPVAVLRAILQDIPEREKLSPALREELNGLVHQTYRLSGLIDDLLLLSRMDAGQLKIAPCPVDLSQLIELALDDLSVRPDQHSLVIEKDYPPEIPILGEKRHVALILQNLLENAQKYNRPNGRIRVAVHLADDAVRLVVGNTTRRPIPAAARDLIFERFHRGTMAEDIPGYGLGLDLARELARLQGGELTLLRSDEQMTEFEVRFQHGDTSPACKQTV